MIRKWIEMKNSPDEYEQDNDGMDGALQIWVNKKRLKLEDESRFTEAVTDQASKQFRNPATKTLLFCKRM